MASHVLVDVCYLASLRGEARVDALEVSGVFLHRRLPISTGIWGGRLGWVWLLRRGELDAGAFALERFPLAQELGNRD